MKHPYLDQSIDDEPKVKVLIDADVVLELFINRCGFVEDVERLLEEIEKSRHIEVYVTDKCLKRIRLEEGLGEDAALYVEQILCGRVIKISRSIRDEARTYCLPDFDSAEEVVCAKNEQLSAIVTQNPNNFDGTNNLQIWTVERLFVTLQLEKNRLIPYVKEKPVTLSSSTVIFMPAITRGFLSKNIHIPLIEDCDVCWYSGQSSLLAALSENINFGDIFVYFSGHGHSPLTEFSWSPPIRFDDLDNWITSKQALLLFQNSYKLLENDHSYKSRIPHAIYSPKYLHKYLLELLLYKFPKKNTSSYYDLPFYKERQKVRSINCLIDFGTGLKV